MDSREDNNMSDDHLLMSELLEAHGITVKQLALGSGYAASHIYRFLAGHATIPMIIWRVLWEKTSDQRIIRLITGETTVEVIPLLEQVPKLDKATIRHLHNERRKQIECEGLVLDILADGVIDGHDRKRIAEYRRAFPELIQSLYQTYQAINDAYDVAMKGKLCRQAKK